MSEGLGPEFCPIHSMYEPASLVPVPSVTWLSEWSEDIKSEGMIACWGCQRRAGTGLNPGALPVSGLLNGQGQG